MSRLQYACDLLKKVTERWPPVTPARHSFTLSDDGQLTLNLFWELVCSIVFFEDDLTPSIDEMLVDIASVLEYESGTEVAEVFAKLDLGR